MLHNKPEEGREQSPPPPTRISLALQGRFEEKTAVLDSHSLCNYAESHTYINMLQVIISLDFL
jgi:hypothetical protein